MSNVISPDPFQLILFIIIYRLHLFAMQNHIANMDIRANAKAPNPVGI